MTSSPLSSVCFARPGMSVIVPVSTSGDLDGDDTITISDAVAVVNYIFGGAQAPDPLSLGDVNCSGSLDIADAVYLINYIFAGGAAPC